MPLALAAILACTAVVGVALLAATPFLPALPSALLYAAGSVVCHQIPERSFHLDAYQLPVCARCFGLYLGAALGAVGAVAWRAARPHRRTAPSHGRTAPSHGRTAPSHRRTVHSALAPRTPHPAPPHLLVLALAAAPTAITWGLEWGLGWPLSNALRAAAGLPLGAGLAAVVTGARPTLHYDECAPPRPIGPGRPPSI